MSRRGKYSNYNDHSSNPPARYFEGAKARYYEGESNKLFCVSTSPVNPDGTFSATFKSLINYTGGGVLTGVWDFGDGKTMKYNKKEPFTHHGYDGTKVYTPKLTVTETYRRNIGTSSEKIEKYTKVKTVEIGPSGSQLNATFKQSSNISHPRRAW